MSFKVFHIFLIFYGLIFGLSAFCLTAPNLSANTLFLYRNSNFHNQDSNVLAPDQTPNGFDIQEMELQFYSDVDPYTRLNLLLSIAPSYISDNQKISQEWTVEPEEVFVESNALADVTLKLGKFKAAMGKHNTMHSHAYPLIEAPLANVALLGNEGLNSSGLSASTLLATSWFSEFTLQYLRGQFSNTEFNSPSSASGIGLMSWKNLMDLNDETTIEVGASFAKGGNSVRRNTSLTAATFILKWRPSIGGRYQSLLWATEHLSRTQSQPDGPDESGRGLASWILYQFTERWSVIYRYDNLIINNSLDTTTLPNDISDRHSLGLSYSPSEFSTYKVEYDRKLSAIVNDKNENIETSIFLQANFTIGAHPTHNY